MLSFNHLWTNKCYKRSIIYKGRQTIMEKIKKRIANLKVAGKLKVYQMTVLVMTLFLVLVALISTLVIRSNIEKITEVWSPSLEYLQDLETMTAKYRIKQYQHLVESDAAVMNSCEEEIQKLESQIQDTGANLDAIMSADSDAQKGRDDYEVANAAWEEYRAASDEILKLSREGKQQEAAKLMTGEVYEEYKAFSEKLTTLRDKFQVELDQAKTMANVCTVIIFIVIVAAGLAIAVVTTLIGRIITNSITEPVEQIEAAVASLRKGELSNVEMLTYESEDEFGDTIRNLKEAMGILADYVSEISVEVKAIAQGDLTRNGDEITDFLGDFSELKTSLLYILKRFNSTLTEISNLAEQVSSNSSEVENASKSLADGATEQAGVIEELNATIDTVVDLAADTAKETQSASARVKASANKANEEKEILVYSNCAAVELFVNGVSQGVKQRNSQDFPAAGLHWNCILKAGENNIKAVAVKGLGKGNMKAAITDEISFNYQTEEWSNPKQLKLKTYPDKGSIVWVEAQLTDNKGIPCLDAANVISFEAAGDGKLIQNLGTSTGSRRVQAYNGRAAIRIDLNGTCQVAVKSPGIQTAFIEVKAE